MSSVSGNAQFCSLTEVLHCSLAGVRRDRADSSQLAFLSSARVCRFPLYTRDFRYPHRKKIGWVQIRGVGWPGIWSVARDHAHSKALLDELNGLMCGMRGGPILLEPLDGMSVRAHSLHYRHEPPENPAVSFPSYRLGAPLSVFRPKGADYARAANSAPRGAIQAVQRSLLNYVRSRSRPEPVVLSVDTPVEFETSFE